MTTKSQTVFPLISEAIAGMNDPRRFEAGEHAIMVVHCACGGKESLRFAPVKVMRLLSQGCCYVKFLNTTTFVRVWAFDLMKLEAVESSEAL